VLDDAFVAGHAGLQLGASTEDGRGGTVRGKQFAHIAGAGRSVVSKVGPNHGCPRSLIAARIVGGDSGN
jgi:hypothetical protein